MATVDLEDAYFVIPIEESFKKFLRFKFENVFYEFNCLPFGLWTAPYTRSVKKKVNFHFFRKIFIYS